MALTKVSTDGVKDDAVTTDKLANAINTERTANTAKVSTTINNNADNRIITGSGTANTLNGESNVIIDSSGRLLLGITSARANFGNNTSGVQQHIQLEGTSSITSSMSLIRNSNDANDGGIIVGKTRGTSVGSNTVVQAGDDLGNISFLGADGTSMQFGADIKATVESGVGNDDMPAALVFSTNGGTTSTTERMRIDSSGNLVIKGSATSDNNRMEIRVNDTQNEFRGSTNSGTNKAFAFYANNTNNSEIATFDSDGLKFGTDTAAANALDDYEEGSFDVTLVGQYGGNAQYSYRAGYYTRIGRVVHVVGDVRFNGSWSGSSGNVYIQLPFGTSFTSGGTVGNGSISEWNLDSSTYDYLGITVDNNSANARITTHDGSNNNTGHLPTGQLGNNRYLKFGFTYITS